MGTNYKSDFYSKEGMAKSVRPKEAFNIEKEHKIINPHKMELTTTFNKYHKGFQVVPEAKSVERRTKIDIPTMGASSYANQYPNWKNGK
jgi:hypothetical protein